MLFLFSPQYLLYTILGIVLLPAIAFSVYAQYRVNKTFSTYVRVPCKQRLSAYQVARGILDTAGLRQIQIVSTQGRLNCYYHHNKQLLALSNDVINSDSVAAISVAAHEAGHALQYAGRYLPVRIRAALVPMLNLSNTLMWPLLLIGVFFLGFSPDMMIGSFPIGKVIVIVSCVFFGLSILFSLVTLPTEYNASARARRILAESGVFDEEELAGAARVLNAAALTYVAALLTSILNLVRILLFFLLIGRRRN